MRPRLYARMPGFGCSGCSAPLLLPGVLAAMYVSVLAAGVAL
ncbi:MAG TPA: hypothetical protein VMW47_13550 [Verrucomicrobiae bacterium]|nr:hypothetical protein [Verrucomicrobiae bacterium]